ncbi:MAG: peroxiredoxin family protein [Sulfuricaulis sp.]
MNRPLKKIGWGVGLTLWLAAGAVYASDATPVQTLPETARPFTAPDFTLKGEDGKTYRLSDYRGKVVLLNFWATWCPPCREEMPSMERAYRKVKSENIAILAVNVGEDADTVFAFTGRYPLTFPLLLDLDGSVIGKYPVVGLPTTFIVDPRGRVTHRAVGSREWDDDRLLNRLRGMLKP